MKQYNCKNCGAPLEHSYNHKCPYCNTLFDFNVPIEKTIKVKAEDLIDLELVDYEFSPVNYSIILLFSGYKCPMPKIYEYDVKEDIYVSNIENYINPPKCGFCIELPICEIREKGFDYIMFMIENTGIRYNELGKIRKQVIEKLGRFWR